MVSPFEGLLGNNSELRTLEFLLPMHGVEFNISELADEMKVTRQTLSKVLKKYDDWGLVKSRSSGQAIFYTLNEDSPLVKSIVQFNTVLIETMLGTETLYEIREYLEERIPRSEPLFSSGYRDGHDEQVWRSAWQGAQAPCGNVTTREEPCWVMTGKGADCRKTTEAYPAAMIHPAVCERGTGYMQHEAFFKKELVKELRNVANLMKNEKNPEKKIYYFSAAYGITGRTFRYAFSRDVLLADLVLSTSYHSLNDRFQRFRSGDQTIPLDNKVFESIVDGLKALADAFENDTSILEPLKLITAAMFSTTGPGNYLREKDDLTL